MGEKDIIRFFENDRFAAMTGAKIIEAREGYCRTFLEIEPKHLNAAGVVQGGAIFTLADFAFAVASNSGGRLALAVNVNISFLRSVTEGTLFAEARELAEPGKLGAYDVKVTDGQGRLVAQFNGMVYRKKDVLSFT
jgi:acyl-CoA thioesterase